MSCTNAVSENEYSAEEIEKWLDDHPEFVHSYFSRKASRSLFSRARPRTQSRDANTPPTSGTSTPVRKISASDLDTSMRGVLKPILNVVDGQTSFLSPDREYYTKLKRASYRKSREELSRLDETELMMELVKDIAEDLELRSLCHKILQNVSILVNGDRCSMFLVQGSVDGPRCLISTVFDVNAESKVEDLDDLEEIQVSWGTGIVGYVAEKGETVNIANAYEDERFNQEIDKKTGYKTRSILCMPVRNSFGDVIAVSQVINKHGHGKINHTFTAEDEKNKVQNFPKVDKVLFVLKSSFVSYLFVLKQMKETKRSSTLGEIFNPAKDCSDIVDNLPGAKDGFYWIKHNKAKLSKGWCDTHTDGGASLVMSTILKTQRLIDILTGTVVTTKFNCSKFGPHMDVNLGWGRMNSCFRNKCPKGYAFLKGVPFKLDIHGSFSYSASSEFSGITHDATAFVGCDAGKNWVILHNIYLTPSLLDNVFRKCKAVNGGTILIVRNFQVYLIKKVILHELMELAERKLKALFPFKYSGFVQAVSLQLYQHECQRVSLALRRLPEIRMVLVLVVLRVAASIRTRMPQRLWKR
ncbi:dual 3, 5 -cyclic-AMP and -GMP phosphodiesterase 11-like, partial [Paramuricea clavata]